MNQCPYDQTAYEKVPGYVSGYGCPVCGGIGPSHVELRPDHDVKRMRAHIALLPDSIAAGYLETVLARWQA